MEDTSQTLTITEAADRAGVHRRTIRRALDRGDFPNARQDLKDLRQPWLIPTSDLDAAGYGPVEDPTGPDGRQSGTAATENGDRAQDSRSVSDLTPGTALVSVDMLSGLFQSVANAERRAAKATAELEFLRERLEQVQNDQSEDDDQHQEFEQLREQLKELRTQLVEDRGREQLEQQQAQHAQRLQDMQEQLRQLVEHQDERSGSWSVPRPMLWGAAVIAVLLGAIVIAVFVLTL